MIDHQVTGAAASAMAALDLQRDELDRLRTENAVLRELVREARDTSLGGLTFAWVERAEKALGD